MTEVKEIDKWPDNDKWAKARKDWDAMPKETGPLPVICTH